MSRLLLADCWCVRGQALPEGRLPEYHDSADQAVRRYLACWDELTRGGRRYWAIHLIGRHVVGVVVERGNEFYGLPGTRGPRRRHLPSR